MLSLCLSRACLGKNVRVLVRTEWRQQKRRRVLRLDLPARGTGSGSGPPYRSSAYRASGRTHSAASLCKTNFLCLSFPFLVIVPSLYWQTEERKERRFVSYLILGDPNLGVHVGEEAFPVAIYRKVIFLPRQARDKLRENSQKSPFCRRTPFPSCFSYACPEPVLVN